MFTFPSPLFSSFLTRTYMGELEKEKIRQLELASAKSLNRCFYFLILSGERNYCGRPLTSRRICGHPGNSSSSFTFSSLFFTTTFFFFFFLPILILFSFVLLTVSLSDVRNLQLPWIISSYSFEVL